MPSAAIRNNWLSQLRVASIARVAAATRAAWASSSWVPNWVLLTRYRDDKELLHAPALDALPRGYYASPGSDLVPDQLTLLSDESPHLVPVLEACGDMDALLMRGTRVSPTMPMPLSVEGLRPLALQVVAPRERVRTMRLSWLNLNCGAVATGPFQGLSPPGATG
jgi:hypothetical protein